MWHEAPVEARSRSTRNVVKERKSWHEHCQGFAPRCLRWNVKDGDAWDKDVWDKYVWDKDVWDRDAWDKDVWDKDVWDEIS